MKSFPDHILALKYTKLLQGTDSNNPSVNLINRRDWHFDHSTPFCNPRVGELPGKSYSCSQVVSIIWADYGSSTKATGILALGTFLSCIIVYRVTFMWQVGVASEQQWLIFLLQVGSWINPQGLGICITNSGGGAVREEVALMFAT